MRISELAQRAGVTVHALRHYEREVVFIAMARRIGFSLPAIGELLPAYRAGHLSVTRMTDALQERVAALDVQIAELQAQRTRVIEHAAWLRAQQHQARAPAKTSIGKSPWPKAARMKDKR